MGFEAQIDEREKHKQKKAESTNRRKQKAQTEKSRKHKQKKAESTNRRKRKAQTEECTIPFYKLPPFKMFSCCFTGLYHLKYAHSQFESGRNLRTSPIHAQLKAEGANFGETNAYERAMWFTPNYEEGTSTTFRDFHFFTTCSTALVF